MVALAGSRQEFLTKTYALLPEAHALPLSKSLPAVRFPAVSSASEGPTKVSQLIAMLHCTFRCSNHFTPACLSQVPTVLLQ